MWEIGTMKVGKTEYKFWIKAFEEGSYFGINEGRISKLMIKRGDEIVCNYDRGWDIHPTDTEAKKVYNQLLKSRN